MFIASGGNGGHSIRALVLVLIIVGVAVRGAFVFGDGDVLGLVGWCWLVDSLGLIDGVGLVDS